MAGYEWATPARSKRVAMEIIEGRHRGTIITFQMAPAQLQFDIAPKFVDHDVVGAPQPTTHYTQGGLRPMKMTFPVDANDVNTAFHLTGIQSGNPTDRGFVSSGNYILDMHQIWELVTLPMTVGDAQTNPRSRVFVGCPRVRLFWGNEAMTYVAILRSVKITYTEFQFQTNLPLRGTYEVVMTPETFMPPLEDVVLPEDQVFIQDELAVESVERSLITTSVREESDQFFDDMFLEGDDAIRDQVFGSSFGGTTPVDIEDFLRSGAPTAEGKPAAGSWREP